MRILSKVFENDKITGCNVVDDAGHQFFVLKDVLKQYTYTNAKITADNKVIGDNIPQVQARSKQNISARTITLYHGSHRGLDGTINAMRSRSSCDFGKGFYTGDYDKQAKMLISDDVNGHFYTLSVDLSALNVYEFTDDVLWALYVGVNRGHIDIRPYSKLQKLLQEIDKHDVIVGLIADDKMMFVYAQFIEGVLTDKALIACLQQVKLGKQFVFKNDAACKKIKILADDQLSVAERRSLLNIKQGMLSNIAPMVANLQRLYRRQGLYIDEILERYK